MQTRKFQQRIESFTCEICGTHVDGDGYTDHCPNCLWSKHVDIHPGDRAAQCNGMMKPIGTSTKKGALMIEYKCEKCGHEHRVKLMENDNQHILRELSIPS